ncbi:MAG: matrixin family metalloprotease [Planctomycetota bacterium]
MFCAAFFALTVAAGRADADPYSLLRPKDPDYVAKWGDEFVDGTPGGEVTYSFVGADILIEETLRKGQANEEVISTDTVALGDFMPGGWEEVIAAAFDAWAAVANITFREVEDMGEANGAFGGSGDIRIMGHAGDFIAHAFRPPSAKPGEPNNSKFGDIHFRDTVNWLIGPDPKPSGNENRSLLRTAIHEIGHAIGLDHVDDINQIMCGGLGTGACVGFHAPQWGDIEGAQTIYGAPVPEPGMIALFGLGAIVLLVLRRRRALRSAAT